MNQQLVYKVADIAQQVGEILLAAGRTGQDLDAQDFILPNLQLLMPEAGIIAEEGRVKDVREWMWIVDPIDGTTNYRLGLPWWSVSIALFYNDKPVLGVVHAPALKQTFITTETGVLLNGESHNISTRELSKAIIATSIPKHYKPEYRDHWHSIARLRDKCWSFRSFGSVALECAYVATGNLDGVVFTNPHIWDYAAGLALMQAAGIQVWQGGNFVASTPTIAESFQSIRGLIRP